VARISKYLEYLFIPFLFLSPVFLFFYSFQRLYKNKYSGALGLALFVFILSLFFNPVNTYDYFRHVEMYDKMDSDFQNFVIYYFLQRQSDFLFFLLVFFLKSIGISSNLLFASINFITVYIYFTVFIKLIKSKNNLFAFILTLFAVLSISYISILSGIRFYFGLSFFLLFFYYLKHNNLIYSLFFLLVSVFVHFSFSPFLLIYLLLLLRKYPIVYKVILIISISSFLLPFKEIFSFFLINVFKNNTSEYINDYVVNSLNIKVNIYALIFKYFLFVPVTLFVLFNKSWNNSFVVLTFILIILWLNVFNFIIFDRYYFVFVSIFFFYLSESNPSLKKNQILYLFFGFSTFNRFVFEIYDNSEVVLSSFFQTNMILFDNIFKLFQFEKY
jgi:hypothetical protein